MSITSNTGPLIALAKVDLLHVLRDLYQTVRIPPAVHRELLAKVGPEAARIDAALRDFIHVDPSPPRTSASTVLGQGDIRPLRWPMRYRPR